MNDIKDIKPPVNMLDPTGIWIFLVVLIIAVIVLYLCVRDKKARAKLVAPLIPELPAWEKAYQALERLRQEQLLEKALFKEFFTRVSDIARSYMENRFDIRAPHMSTDEFLYYLGVTGHLNEIQKESLKEFLNSCDMVKFARYAPTQQEAWKNFDCAKRLVDDTRI